ncbi:unnamed protein product [Blepharisma stoltei]|uniref:EF-hand domain-containing protein n=1 Tax=Blepharisma stoltei TaxID=1481888 RepID=A0AAU9K5B0_9CILI|nr:unnamed protein product [Blepharisma stoltei]
MSYPQMKFDPKSPPSIRNDDDSMKDYEDRLFERRQIKQQQNRPQSAKINDFQSISSKRKSSYPTTTKPVPPQKPLIKTKNDQDLTFLAKLRPRVVQIDKERLYEDNMALKLKMNSLTDEMVKLKTKINQLERELARKEDIIDDLRNPGEKMPMQNKQGHLISSLKQTIKELKADLQTKYEENATLKQNIKSTKGAEMEIEIQAYIDECTRLRHHLEELMRQKDSPQSLQEASILEEKFKQQSILLNNVKKENQELLIALDENKQELSRWRERVMELEKSQKKNNKNRKTETGAKLKDEVHKLKVKLENSNKKEAELKNEVEKFKKMYEDTQKKLMTSENRGNNHYRAEEKTPQRAEIIKAGSPKPVFSEEEKVFAHPKLKNPNKFLRILHEVVAKERSTIERLLDSFNGVANGNIEVNSIISELKKRKIPIKKKIIYEAISQATGKTQEPVSLRSLIELYNKYEYTNEPVSPISEDEIENQNNPAKRSEPPKVNTSSNSQPESKSQTPATKEIAKPPSPTKTNPPNPVQKEVQIPCIKLEQVKMFLNHIALRMQLHRLPKNNLGHALFENTNKDLAISKQDLLLLLAKQPFNFTNKNEAEPLARFLIEPENLQSIPESAAKSAKNSPKDILSRLLKYIGDWEIFTSEDEESFDKQLSQIISKNKITLKEACKIHDDNNEGMITIDQFKEALSDLDIKFPPRTFNYMTLLFYSHNYELNSVPYRHFIKAYGSVAEENEEGSEGDEDMSDEERAKIVRHYLGQISKALNKVKKTVKEVFECDKKGLISPDQLLRGLISLKIQEIDHEHVLLIIEALQYEEENERDCISIDELEEILVHYGVPAQRDSRVSPNSKKSSRSSSSSNSAEGGHVKKISMLESSGNYEYSDELPEKQEYHKSSPGLSENSPFASMSAAEMNKNPSLHSFKKESDADLKKLEEFSPEEKPANKLGVVSKIAREIDNEEEGEYQSDYQEEYEEEEEQKTERSSVVYKSSGSSEYEEEQEEEDYEENPNDSSNYESDYESEDIGKRLNRSR